MTEAQTPAALAAAEIVHQGEEDSTATRLAQKLAARRAKAAAEASAAAPAVTPAETVVTAETVNQTELMERIREELMREESAQTFLDGAGIPEIQKLPKERAREKALRTHFAIMCGMEGVLARLQATATESLDRMLGYRHKEDLRKLSDGALRETLKTDAREIITGSVGEVAELCLRSDDVGMVAAGLAISRLPYLQEDPEIAHVIDEITGDECSSERLAAIADAVGILDQAVRIGGSGIRFGNQRVKVVQVGRESYIQSEHVDRTEARTADKRVQEFMPEAGEANDGLLLDLVNAAVKAPPIKPGSIWRHGQGSI